MKKLLALLLSLAMALVSGRPAAAERLHSRSLAGMPPGKLTASL